MSTNLITDCFVLQLSAKFDFLCRNALLLHCRRANYQVAIWRKALMNAIDARFPDEHGWIVQANQLSIRWITQEQSAPELLKHYFCKFQKTKFVQNFCSCYANSIWCTEICSCVGCLNIENTVIEIQLLNDLSDDDNFDDICWVFTCVCYFVCIFLDFHSQWILLDISDVILSF